MSEKAQQDNPTEAKLDELQYALSEAAAHLETAEMERIEWVRRGERAEARCNELEMSIKDMQLAVDEEIGLCLSYFTEEHWHEHAETIIKTVREAVKRRMSALVDSPKEKV